jgi:hypothetical protein
MGEVKGDRLSCPFFLPLWSISFIFFMFLSPSAMLRVAL